MAAGRGRRPGVGDRCRELRRGAADLRRRLPAADGMAGGAPGRHHADGRRPPRGLDCGRRVGEAAGAGRPSHGTHAPSQLRLPRVRPGRGSAGVDPGGGRQSADRKQAGS